MGSIYKRSQYVWLWGRCIGFSYATASAIAGSVSLLGGTSAGAILYTNATRTGGVETLNILIPQIVFISFISVFIGGVAWSTIFAVRKYMGKQKPSIFSSGTEQRIDALEQGMSGIKREMAVLEKKVEDNADTE